MPSTHSPLAKRSPGREGPGAPEASRPGTTGAGLHPLIQAKLLGLEERTKTLAESNRRMRDKAGMVKMKQGNLQEQNEVLLERIMAMERVLGDRAPLPAEETTTFQMYSTRTGEIWPPRMKEGRPPFVGLKYPHGSAVHAMRAILAQLFDSVAHAAQFFNTGQRRMFSIVDLKRGMKRTHIFHLEAEHLLFDLDIKPEDGITMHRFLEAFRWETDEAGPDYVQICASPAAARAALDKTVNAILAKNPAGWDAIEYMEGKLSPPREHSPDARRPPAKASSPPRSAQSGIQGGRIKIMNARDKFLLHSGSKPTERALRARQKPQGGSDEGGDGGWGGALGGDKAIIEDILSLDLSLLEHGSKRLDFSGALSARSPQTALRSPYETRGSVPSIYFSPTGGMAQRLERRHQRVAEGVEEQPKLSAVTADADWLKNGPSSSIRASYSPRLPRVLYDLDGRPVSAGGFAGREEEMSPNAMRPASGEQDEVEAMEQRRQQRNKDLLEARSRLEHASPANLAYMQIQDLAKRTLDEQKANPRPDQEFKKALRMVSTEYKPKGTLQARIASRLGQSA